MSKQTLPSIAIGADHAGVALKATLAEWLSGQGYTVQDLGTHDDVSVDYPDFGRAVAEAVAGKRADLGVVICGSGIGISIAANRVPQARAALCHDAASAALARQHNDANILALGARVVSPALALTILQTFLATEFEGGRHQARVEKLN
jgi:ribose 5-phosphate isomerase B